MASITETLKGGLDKFKKKAGSVAEEAKHGARILFETGRTAIERSTGNGDYTAKLPPDTQKYVDEKLNRPKAKKAMK